MKTNIDRIGIFSEKSSVVNSQQVVVDLTDQETNKLLANPLINSQEKLATSEGRWIVPAKVKRVIKGFLEQGKITAQGGAVPVNHIALVLNLMGYKLTTENHKQLETVLLSYWGLRGATAAIFAATDLKNQAPNAIDAYTLTEKNVIRILNIVGFLRRMPLPFGINSALQIAFSLMVVNDQFHSAKALVEGRPDPSGGSFQEIKKQYEGQMLMIVLATAKERLFKGIPMGAATYTAGSALTSTFVDATLPVDPQNQEEILELFALTMAILGALSLFHPVTNQIADQVRAFSINIGLVFWALVSLVYYYSPEWFSEHSLETGIMAFIFVGFIPAVLEATVSIWNYQDKISPKPQDEMQSTVEEVIEEPVEHTTISII